VAPEARGRRVGSRLLERVQEIARARGDALVALYPYRQGYYARLGYTAVTPYRHLRFAPSALALPAAGLRVRPASVADRPAMAACWVETGRRRTGTLVRTERTWEAALSDEAITWLVADGEGGPEGLIAWTVTQRELHGATTLLVREVAATTDRAWRALWGAAAAQRDQVDEVQVDLPEDDPLPRALIDGDRIARRDRAVAHPLGLLADGPMLRLLDAPRAMAARGWPESGRVVLDLDGTRLALEASGGRATLEPTREEAVIRLDAVTLTALSFGGLRAKDAAWLGRLHARTADGLARADALLGLPAYFSSDRF
jgi:predicted acetyltransferase